MKFRAIVQARLASTRLPDKILEKIGSLSILEHIAQRVKKIESAGIELVFAIPENEIEALAPFFSERGLIFATGSERDVLARYLAASADLTENDYVIRLTGDNPFLDHEMLGKIIERLKNEPVDFIHTADCPLGMGTEIVSIPALRSQKFRDLKDHHLEHVTTFIKENPHLYEIQPVRLDETASADLAQNRIAGIRMTIDEPLDLTTARAVYSHFEHLGKPLFTSRDVILLKKNFPELLSANLAVAQKSSTSTQG